MFLCRSGVDASARRQHPAPNESRSEGRTVRAEGRSSGPAAQRDRRRPILLRGTQGADRRRQAAQHAQSAAVSRGALGCGLSVVLRPATSGRTSFAEGYSLRRLNLSQRELLGLVTLKRLGSSLGGTLSAYIEETTAKLLQSSDQRSATAMHVVVAGDPAGVGRARAATSSATSRRLQAAERDHRRRAVRLHRQDRRADPAARRPLRLHRLERPDLSGRLRSRAHRHARLRRRQHRRDRGVAADVRAAGRLQPRSLRRATR